MYLDTAADRLASRHVTRIEEARAAAIFAHDQKSYAKWSRASQPRKPGLVGYALEQAVMGIAALFPNNVSRGTV